MLVKVLLKIYNFVAFTTARIRARFWGLFTKSMGSGVHILAGVKLHSPHGISIGDSVSINYDTSLGGTGELVIGDYVLIGPNCTILSGSHEIKDWKIPMMHQGVTLGKVVLEEDVWLGEGVTVLPNVTIGRGAIVGAKAVVTKDVPPFAIVGGVPAKVIKYRFDKKTIKKALKHKFYK